MHALVNPVTRHQGACLGTQRFANTAHADLPSRRLLVPTGLDHVVGQGGTVHPFCSEDDTS